ncbi:hypothetical protein OMP38_18265 [Cohnella ginsengisoli]|uniref:Uncharacterized protein n=1 Tax=Cohnella ginsengisoli TaxID=425004 RepID=A0A9X4QMY9_9BACL|nr:hypothetical protein [Cohnella ginsengisoli]MDG0792604.1 hypothetical protein [Cohnella ginsengisoli]
MPANKSPLDQHERPFVFFSVDRKRIRLASPIFPQQLQVREPGLRAEAVSLIAVRELDVDAGALERLFEPVNGIVQIVQRPLLVQLRP